MPTYDYECSACEHKFEKFQSITAPAIRKCPACGKLKVNWLIGTGGAVIFKGNGFYHTDYRSDSYRKAADKDKPATPCDSCPNSKANSSNKDACPGSSQ